MLRLRGRFNAQKDPRSRGLSQGSTGPLGKHFQLST